MARRPPTYTDRELLEIKMREVLRPKTVGELKAENAIIKIGCRMFNCGKDSQVPIREIPAPDHLTKLKDLTFFGLKCPHCGGGLMIMSIVR